jgi:type IV pilus assembly protein PilP
MMGRIQSLTILAVLGLAQLQGCGTQEEEPLTLWMQRERELIKPNVTPIPEPTRFEPYQYTSEALVEPFSKEKLAGILRTGQSANQRSALIDAELQRRKQPLESFPLDSMVMVGTLQKKDGLTALVKVGALLYQVKAGAYLGQDFGRVMKIAENEITLREIAQDAAGEWIERPAALQLQEDTSK